MNKMLTYETSFIGLALGLVDPYIKSIFSHYTQSHIKSD